MQSILLFGATGHLGKRVAAELAMRGYPTTCVVRNEAKAHELKHPLLTTLIANVTNPAALEGITEGFDVIISCLGKSVSPNDRSPFTFQQIDLEANTNILKDAVRNNVKKFVYVSALHSERYTHLEYFRVHHAFSEVLKQSGIDYAIVKPPALFSAFQDVIAMARKGQLVNLGSGTARTNPIFEGDLARVVVDSIAQPNAVIEAGGKHTYTRRQLNEIIQQQVNPGKKLTTVPIGVIKALLPILKLFDRNTYHKFAFFIEVMQHDVLAPPVGEKTFEAYIQELAG